MKKSAISIILLSITIILMVGCRAQNLVSQPPETSITIEGFKPLKDSFIDYKFKTHEEQDSFNITGEYDLNNDGSKDQISLVLQKHSDSKVETYLQVNDISQEIYMHYTYDGETRLVDLDQNDEFIEIAFFDEGPSADPMYYFYRYDGKELYNIGYIDDRALINGEGKILPSGYISDFEPAFYSAWLEVDNNEFILKDKNIDEYLEKKYTLHKRDDAFFVPMEEMPEDFSPSWDEMREFQTTELTLIDIYFPYYDNKLLNFYFVELANGEKGMLYFWVGD